MSLNTALFKDLLSFARVIHPSLVPHPHDVMCFFPYVCCQTLKNLWWYRALEHQMDMLLFPRPTLPPHAFPLSPAHVIWPFNLSANGLAAPSGQPIPSPQGNAPRSWSDSFFLFPCVMELQDKLDLMIHPYRVLLAVWLCPLPLPKPHYSRLILQTGVLGETEV